LLGLHVNLLGVLWYKLWLW